MTTPELESRLAEHGATIRLSDYGDYVLRAPRLFKSRLLVLEGEYPEALLSAWKIVSGQTKPPVF